MVWTHQAGADRHQIREYIAEDNPTAALALEELISEKASRLADHPGLGRPGRVTGTSEFVIHPNYILICDAVGESVCVLRVLHAAKQWPLPRG